MAVVAPAAPQINLVLPAHLRRKLRLHLRQRHRLKPARCRELPRQRRALRPLRQVLRRLLRQRPVAHREAHQDKAPAVRVDQCRVRHQAQVSLVAGLLNDISRQVPDTYFMEG